MPPVDPRLDQQGPITLGAPKAEKPVSVSLRYWHTGSQCLSDWQKKELSGLRKLIDKLQKLTPTAIRSDPGLFWKAHSGAAARGFSRPSDLSADITLCEVRVSGKARVHAALHDGLFYLVWLDRNHDVFPSGK